MANNMSPDVGRILTKLTTYKYEVPQGIPTSTHIANLVALPIDQRLIEICDANLGKYPVLS